MAAAERVLFVSIDGRNLLRLVLGSGRYTLGRRPGNTVCLPAPDVAPEHAVLELKDGEATLRHRAQGYVTLLEGVALPDGEQYRLNDAAAGWAIGPFDCMLIARRAGAGAADPPATLHASERWPDRHSTVLPLVAQGREDDEAVVAALAAAPAGRYLYDLPDLYHDESGFLARYLKIFETLWEPLEQRQDQIALYFDPRTCPAALLGWLAGWLGFPLEPRLPEHRQRAVLGEALWLLRWRGTAYGLTRLIELATGVEPELSVVPEPRPDGGPGGPVIVLRLPRRPAEPELTEDLIGELVERFKPAHCGYSLELP